MERWNPAGFLVEKQQIDNNAKQKNKWIKIIKKTNTQHKIQLSLPFDLSS